MIGLLTFHWADDYGAMLQAYALKSCLEQEGGAVEIIPYAPYKLVGRYWLIPLQFQMQNGKVHFLPAWSAQALVYNLSHGQDFWQRRRKMAEFRRRFLTNQPPIWRIKGIRPEQYSCIFVGSDQVWNPNITMGLDGAYMGNIPGRGDVPMVAYAASMGGKELPEAYRDEFARSVGKAFSAISLRERCAVPFVRELLHREVTDVLDPVLLLEREQLERISVPPQEEGYVLVYQTEYNDSLMEYARRLGQQLGKSVISVTYPVNKGTPEWVRNQVGIGPEEFAGYVRNAACVVTNSFHGTALSILLRKQFLVFFHRTSNTRMQDLLEKLGLAGRMVERDASPEEGKIWEEVDWSNAYGCLEAEQEHSREFIRKNISGGV